MTHIAWSTEEYLRQEEELAGFFQEQGLGMLEKINAL